jgi:hypothetical protein
MGPQILRLFLGVVLIANAAERGHDPPCDARRRNDLGGLFGDQSPLGPDKPYNPAQLTATLFVVPLPRAAAGFLARRKTDG